MNIQQTALLRYLAKGDPLYFGKVLELRDAVTEWLSYIPQTFPHYTRHTIGHSEQIIAQLSSLLFKETDLGEPCVPLSRVEAFILCVAAYLHDSGMVCADGEKRRILDTPAWKEWISEGGAGAKRWSLVAQIRASGPLGSPDVANFLADVQARFLIAEFIRARHHLRGGDVVNQHEATLGRFAFEDPVLKQTIADVCIAHGLNRSDLEDPERFPDERDIRGEKANVRFLAILFRLGDLLDMSSDRACPLLLNAAWPIPAESLAHWTQYQRITHRNTSPDAIEIYASCFYQEEHRVLADWCKWIVDEVLNAAVIMRHAKRHSSWRPPIATIDGRSPTIRIRPDAKATYIPSTWRLELDQSQIIDRLIHDAYDDPVIFIRELIQNSLDASRCRLYESLHSAGEPLPPWPVDIESKLREQFSVRISITDVRRTNPLSGEEEAKQVISVEDDGIGMSRDIVERYLLQIGRSYYRSTEFRRQFPFNPTSQFGIGFLSTFAVSDEIHIDTFRPGSNGSPLRLTLTGPRNYLLTEHSSREVQGTRVEVVMRRRIPATAVAANVRGWCKRVEFPVIIAGPDRDEMITAERSDAFTSHTENVTDPKEHFLVISHPFRGRTSLGEIYIFVSTSAAGERWDRYGWARFQYPKLHPMARVPELPDSMLTLHGVAVSSHAAEGRSLLPFLRGTGAGFSVRLDVRGADMQFNLSRSAFGGHSISVIEAEIKTKIAGLLDDHLKTSLFAIGDQSWLYRQRLMDCFPIAEYWDAIPLTTPVTMQGGPRFLSVNEVRDLLRFVTVYRHAAIHHNWYLPNNDERQEQEIVAADRSDACLLEECIACLSDFARTAIFEGCVPMSATFYPKGILAVQWARSDSENSPQGFAGYGDSRPAYAVPFVGSHRLSVEVHPGAEKYFGPMLLNANHPFTQWLLRVSSAEAGIHKVVPDQIHKMLELLATPTRLSGYGVGDIERYLTPWREASETPDTLRPPKLDSGDFIEPRATGHFPR